MDDPGLITLIAVILAASVFLLTLINTDAAITLLIFSMLLSPEIKVGQLSLRAVVIRFDDLLLGVVFFTWIAKLAINKQLGLLRSTPFNVPLGAFIVCGVISSAWGVANATVPHPTASFFYSLKYFEYFLLFFMTANAIHERRQVEWFLGAMLVTALIVTLNGYQQILTHGAAFRVTAPFEGHPEPNTLAGYFVVMLAICSGLLLYSRSFAQRLVLLAAIAVMLIPFMYTYSRGGYLAFLAMYLTLCLLSRQYRFLLWGLLGLGVLVAPMVVPASVFARIKETFDPHSTVAIGTMRLSASPAYRLLAWKLVFDKWLEHPLLGYGVTGLGFFVDNQHALVLGEMGVLGFLAYLWVRWRLLAIGYRYFKTMTDPLAQGLCLGFLAAVVGLLIESFTGEIFIIVRIMEPFWFLAAIVVVLPILTAPTPAPARGVPTSASA